MSVIKIAWNWRGREYLTLPISCKWHYFKALKGSDFKSVLSINKCTCKWRLHRLRSIRFDGYWILDSHQQWLTWGWTISALWDSLIISEKVSFVQVVEWLRPRNNNGKANSSLTLNLKIINKNCLIKCSIVFPENVYYFGDLRSQYNLIH